MENSLRISVFVVALYFAIFSSALAEGKVIRIDTHAHFVPPFYYELLVSNGITAGGLLPKWNVFDHLAFMDSMGIEISVLSVSLPAARLTPFDVGAGRKVARQLNEYGHMLTLSYPERFQFFATLTLPDVEGSVAEAIYSLDTLKAAGVALMANSHGEYLGSKKFDPLMEVLNDREATVFIHPSSFDLRPVTNELGEIPPYVMDFLLDTTRAATNLAMMKVTTRYPNIKFLLAHSGGFLPFAAYRMSEALSWTTDQTPQSIFTELQKFYVDTALSSTPSAMPSTLEFIPINQITYGSDYPYAYTSTIRSISQSFDEYPLEDEQRQHINFHCAHSLFQKQLSHWTRVWHQDTDQYVETQLHDH